MHAHALYVFERLNGALQLAFQRSLIIHFFVKLGLSPTEFVEQLETKPSAARHLARCHFQARGVQLVGGNADGFAVGADFIGDVFFRKTRRKGLCVGRFHVGVERLEVGLSDQFHEDDQQCRGQQSSAQQNGALFAAEPGGHFLELAR